MRYQMQYGLIGLVLANSGTDVALHMTCYVVAHLQSVVSM